uniref:Uncharacterized protein n=1 Tax=Leptobrachium leishanense TaxID=445787 RepID=A0A8C5Q2S0_9ANUR
MDFITDLPMSSNHNTLMVVIDRFSKMAHFIPTKHLPTASETATLFIKHIFSLDGLPESITTDRGTQFTSHFWTAFCKGLLIQSNLSTAFHPQTNGQTERVNGILEQYLRCYITHLQDNWRQYIPIAEFVYNNQKQSATKYSPFFINDGRHPVMLPGAINSDTPTTDQRLKDILQNNKIICDNLHHAQLRHKVYADQKRSPPPAYALGNKVWLATKNIKLHCPSRKLGPKFIGPFPITKIISPTAVQLSLPESYKIHPVFHVSLLRLASEDPFPGRIPPRPGPVSSDDDRYEVKDLLDSRIRRNKLEYLVRWKGYGSDEDSRVLASEVSAPALIRRFHKRHPDCPRRGRFGGGAVMCPRPHALGPRFQHIPHRRTQPTTNVSSLIRWVPWLRPRKAAHARTRQAPLACVPGNGVAHQ